MSLSPLTAAILCRDALMLYSQFSLRPPSSPPPLPPHFPNPSQEGLFHQNALIPDEALTWPLSFIFAQIIASCIAHLFQEAKNHVLGEDHLELPHGVTDAANESYDGVSMRCIVQTPFHWRPSFGPVNTHQKTYYNINTDSLLRGPCCTSILWTVHRIGAATKISSDNP